MHTCLLITLFRHETLDNTVHTGTMSGWIIIGQECLNGRTRSVIAHGDSTRSRCLCVCVCREWIQTGRGFPRCSHLLIKFLKGISDYAARSCVIMQQTGVSQHQRAKGYPGILILSQVLKGRHRLCERKHLLALLILVFDTFFHCLLFFSINWMQEML